MSEHPLRPFLKISVQLSAKTFTIATGTLPLTPPIGGIDKVGYLTDESH